MKTFFSFFFLLITFSIFAQEKPEGLFINSKAPEFKLQDQSGVDISLKELRKKGQVVMIFYQGNWSPYCNKELLRFQDSLQFITDKGAKVIAITPEASEGISKTIEKTKAVFPILYDEEMKVSKAYQVAYEVDERTLNRQKSFGNDLLAVNNQKLKAFLPIPAVYIINKEGTVTTRFFETDPRKRPWVREVLQELK
ncbi:peroxiredoxin family protein [Chitinophagaceae bacterium LB-8]|uniref:thioredoxin-dependent peroxiredoxin n=1 Tax=Paraflavisolibacter caeni TaxID=2982496 RepID=A0A9X3BI25_9BACT|nr:peroxiredoxin family protein [Paraflavisolibacter caeni]MCU7550612.1 peroxiredoxin family protein [Paraflavisolibacter caeni]